MKRTVKVWVYRNVYGLWAGNSKRRCEEIHADYSGKPVRPGVLTYDDGRPSPTLPKRTTRGRR